MEKTGYQAASWLYHAHDIETKMIQGGLCVLCDGEDSLRFKGLRELFSIPLFQLVSGPNTQSLFILVSYTRALNTCSLKCIDRYVLVFTRLRVE